MAMPGTPEYNFGMRFKELYENEKKAKQDAENHFKEARKQLETEMEQLKHANDRSIYRKDYITTITIIISLSHILQREVSYRAYFLGKLIL
jgi:uncharacterized membrane protein YcjF (UPF0283 family)